MIAAIILAAGQSKRMGRPKMLMPWGESTVLQTVIATFRAAGVDDILVVTGAGHERVEELVGDSAQTVFNAGYERGEMLSSIQAGLAAQPPGSGAVLIGLGDQPQVRVVTVQHLLDAHAQAGSSIIVPSYQNHRGHPWLVARAHWEEVLRLRPPETMRQFLIRHAAEIHYIESADSSVLADLDTPDDYLKYRP